MRRRRDGALTTAGPGNPAPIVFPSSVLAGIAPLNTEWRELVQFAAQYYQRALGEVALAALPPQLRDLQPEQLARRLQATLRPGDSLARLLGDEFLLLLEQCDGDSAVASADRLHQLLLKPLRIGTLDVALDCRIGIAAYPADAVAGVTGIDAATVRELAAAWVAYSWAWTTCSWASRPVRATPPLSSSVTRSSTSAAIRFLSEPAG